MTTTRLTVADAAARYAAAGWPVHPLHDTVAGHCSCADGPACRQAGKHPRTTHGFHDATTAAKAVTAWWRRWPHANIGIPTGTVSRLAVIDLDGPTGAATWRHLTTGRDEIDAATAVTPHGRHHWYRLPDGLTVPRSIRGLGDGIDVLGDDGYAIAPPSNITAPCPKHGGERCGTAYTWTAATRHLAPIPAWIAQRLNERRHHVHDGPAVDNTRQQRPCAATAERSATGQQMRHPRRYALAALRGEADRVRQAPAGRRNATLNYAAWRLATHLRDGTLTEHEIRDALALAAAACGLTNDDGARTVHTTITSALRSGGRSL
jgi:hypothetical protein